MLSSLELPCWMGIKTNQLLKRQSTEETRPSDRHPEGANTAALCRAMCQTTNSYATEQKQQRQQQQKRQDMQTKTDNGDGTTQIKNSNKTSDLKWALIKHTNNWKRSFKNTKDGKQTKWVKSAARTTEGKAGTQIARHLHHWEPLQWRLRTDDRLATAPIKETLATETSKRATI